MTSEGETVVGRYVLVRPLGRGGMAEVWEARDDVLRRPVALKLFFVTGDASDARRAVGEMHTLAGLSHPNLVAVYDAGTDGDRTYLVLELVSGTTLADRMAAPGLDVATAATVGEQVAAGLAYIHGRGIVHRDVKPANVLLPVRDHVDAPVAKLADFGIAQHAGQDRLTQVGMTIGTAQYLAPEQVTGKPVGPPADVYALGLVLLEALGHGQEWTGTPVEIAVARLSRPPVVPPGVPWARLLRAMTATDPAARPTAAQVRAGLAAAGAAGSTGATRAVARDGGGVAALDATALMTTPPTTATPPRTTAMPPRTTTPPPTTAMPVPPSEPRDGRRRRAAVLVGLALLAGAVGTVIAIVASSGPAGTSTPAGTPAATTPVAATTGPPTAAATTPPATTPATTVPAATTSSPTAPTTTAPPATTAGPNPPGGGPGSPKPGPPGQTKSKPKDKPGG